jgi:ribosomal-protein-alanine N-acetyltransferase
VSVSEETALRFERIKPDYIERLMALELRAYPDPWTYGMFQQELQNQTSHFFLAFRNGILVGYVGFWLMLEEAHITKVTVDAPFRRQGIGRQLMEFLLEQAVWHGATTARLEVRESNDAARQLYADLGFVESGRRSGYYSKTNETAIVMSMRLDNG